MIQTLIGSLYLVVMAMNLNAAVPNRVRSISDLDEPSIEFAYRVKTAKIILADYDLIRTDFDETKKMTDLEIDNWLLNKAAYMTPQQIAQTEVNTKIEVQVDSNNRYLESTVYRPRGYGRALFFPSLIDGKGFGSRKPSLKNHRTGLATLGEVIREYIFQKKFNKFWIIAEVGFKQLNPTP